VGGRDRNHADYCRAYRHALGILDNEVLDALGRARRISQREAKVLILGLAGPWRGWRPTIRLKGEAHLRAALRQGKGVILWESAFEYGHLMLKMALSGAGYRATQLSRPAHGFGRARIELQLLNRIWTGVEDRFLARRVVIRGNETGPALEALRACLAANGIVLIMVGNEARRTTEVPLLGRWFRLAAGPIRLAQSTGAQLLPAFAVRNADGVFEATIEQPLSVPPESAGRESYPSILAALARRIEPYVARYPEQWMGWRELILTRNEESLDGATPHANRHSRAA
jgi:lauroyl/myristoyl acyltransferase